MLQKNNKSLGLQRTGSKGREVKENQGLPWYSRNRKIERGKDIL